jgi:hypothetical protein
MLIIQLPEAIKNLAEINNVISKAEFDRRIGLLKGRIAIWLHRVRPWAAWLCRKSGVA